MEGPKLKKAREAIGQTQAEIATRTGIPRTRLSRAECGLEELTDAENSRVTAAILAIGAERMHAATSILFGTAEERKTVQPALISGHEQATPASVA
jgi:transcriptional regulator with XRE-family HTH domain